jgi:hypothetical protein
MAKSKRTCHAIEAKYGFSIPSEYRSMEAAGCFELRHPGKKFKWEREPTYLLIHGWDWLRPQEILDYKPEEYHKPGFVPFARDVAGDHYCWWPSQHPQTVVLCPHDDEFGTFYARSVLDAIYRQCLEYACMNFAWRQEDFARQCFAEWAKRLSEYFPPTWIETLQALGRADLIRVDVPKEKPVPAAQVFKRVKQMLKRLEDRATKNPALGSHLKEIRRVASDDQYLMEIASRPPKEREEELKLLTNEQYEALVKRDLRFPRINKKFNWMR